MEVRKQFKCFVSGSRAGRPWEDITATFLDLYLTNVTLDSAGGAKSPADRSCLRFAGIRLLLLLLGAVYKATADCSEAVKSNCELERARL